jgi:hypothetical protein
LSASVRAGTSTRRRRPHRRRPLVVLPGVLQDKREAIVGFLRA